MMNWLGLDKETIFKDNDADGNRYLNQFLRDYERIFNITDLEMGNTTEPKEYQLKPKYNGIPLKFGSSVMVTNTNITKEYAKFLIKNHPRGEGLFNVLPKPEVKKPKPTATTKKQSPTKND